MRLGLLVLLALPASAWAGDSDKDGISNGKDACRNEPETVNGWSDLDGCPDALGRLSVVVKDLETGPVAGATVTVGDRTATSGPDGAAVFDDLMPDTVVPLAVVAAGFQEQDAGDVHVEEGPFEQVVTLDWLPVKVYVRARDPERGVPVDANVRLDGPGFVDPQRTGDDGEVLVELRPGPWKLTVYADHYLQAQVDLPLAAGTEPVAVDVDLAPSWTAFDGSGVAFDAGQVTLGASARSLLDAMAGDLIAWDHVRLEIQGFEDPGAPDLSLARAEAVRAFLLGQGVAESQIVLHAVGESDPVASEASPEGQALNRRVAVVPLGEPALAEVVGHAYVTFEPGRSEVRDGSELARAVAALKANPTARVDLVGHAAPSDRLLDRRRAEAVMAYLTERTVPPGRMYVTGKGAPTEPRGVGFRVLAAEESVALPEAVYFAAGGTEAALPEVVADLAARVRVDGAAHLLLLGHSDSGESTTLARRRADGLRTALIAAGVEATRIETRSLGDDLVAEEGASPFNRRVDVIRVPGWALRDRRVEFAAGSATVPADADATLKAVAQALKRNPTARVKVLGVGTASDGEAAPTIGVQRAGRVLTALVGHGADLGNLEPGGVATRSTGPGFVAFELASLRVTEATSYEPLAVDVAPGHERVLGEVLRAMLEFHEVRFELRGFAGPTDADAARLGKGPKVDLGDLALRRAEKAQRWLVLRGADPARLSAVGAALDAVDPAVPDRRVEFVVTAPGT